MKTTGKEDADVQFPWPTKVICGKELETMFEPTPPTKKCPKINKHHPWYDSVLYCNHPSCFPKDGEWQKKQKHYVLHGTLEVQERMGQEQRRLTAAGEAGQDSSMSLDADQYGDL